MILRAVSRFVMRVWSTPVRFFGAFMLVIVLTYGFLYAIDFIPEAPEEIKGSQTNEPKIQEPVAVAQDPTPDRLIFDSLDREIAVLNPASADVATLDNALLSGAVRHPNSANLLKKGTVFLFGHSSYLPVVHNKNFQAFNGIQNRKRGDKIRLQSEDFEYVYRVDRVYEVKATAASVEIEEGEAKLTLVTCNTFGSKEDRFVVEATLIDSYPLQS